MSKGVSLSVLMVAGLNRYVRVTPNDIVVDGLPGETYQHTC